MAERKRGCVCVCVWEVEMEREVDGKRGGVGERWRERDTDR